MPYSEMPLLDTMTENNNGDFFESKDTFLFSKYVISFCFFVGYLLFYPCIFPHISLYSHCSYGSSCPLPSGQLSGREGQTIDELEDCGEDRNLMKHLVVDKMSSGPLFLFLLWNTWILCEFKSLGLNY